MINSCAVPQNEFHYFMSLDTATIDNCRFIMLCYLMLLFSLQQQIQSSQPWGNPGLNPRADIHSYYLFKELLQQSTPGQQETV